MVVNAALYPPACPTRIRKSRLVNPIESTFFLNVDKTAQGNNSRYAKAKERFAHDE
jgi:hypothetical protein